MLCNKRANIKMTINKLAGPLVGGRQAGKRFVIIVIAQVVVANKFQWLQ